MVINLANKINNKQIEKNMIQIIDSVVKIHIQGPLLGSYMVSEKDAPILTENTDVNNIKITQIQSLWKMENDFMGGIYRAYYFNNPQFKQPFIIYTYLYAPGENKSIPMIQLDAIVYSVRP